MSTDANRRLHSLRIAPYFGVQLGLVGFGDRAAQKLSGLLKLDLPCRRIASSQPLFTVTCAASTSKKRNIELPYLVMWPSRLRLPLESSNGTSPR